MSATAPRIRIPNGFTPRSYQRRLMSYFDKGGKRAVCVWHRRAGKDLVALHQACKMAHKRRGVYWHCLPTYRQAKKALWDGFTSDGQRIMDTVFPPAIVRRRNESEMLVELRCGSIVQLVGSDTIDNLVGAGPVHVTFSEFGLSKPNCWDLVRPMLRENGGSASFISTPRGNNHFKKLYDIARGDPSWFCEKLGIFETGAFPEPQRVVDEEIASGMPDALVRQEYLVDFSAALVGSVWGDLLERLEKAGAFSAFEHPKTDVFTTWDLGTDDSTAIWFWRIGKGGGVDFVDHYEASGKPMSHYTDVLAEKGYQYVKHWLPHDARQRSWLHGTNIVDQFVAEFGAGAVAVVPGQADASFMDGIQAGRWLLQKPTRFHSRCAPGVECLKAYHYGWDEETKVLSKKPVHDWSSHSADSFRYTGVVAKYTETVMRPEAPPVRAEIKPAEFTFPALSSIRGPGRGRM